MQLRRVAEQSGRKEDRRAFYSSVRKLRAEAEALRQNRCHDASNNLKGDSNLAIDSWAGGQRQRLESNGYESRVHKQRESRAPPRQGK